MGPSIAEDLAAFAVELGDGWSQGSEEGDDAAHNKRPCLEGTPERFRPPGSTAAAAAATAAHSQPPHTTQSGASQPPEQRPGSSRWGLRTLFLGSGSSAATPVQAQHPGSGQHATAPANDSQCQLGGAPPPAAAARSPAAQRLGLGGLDVDGNDGVGPLTQMAAAHAPVATAFCPSCGAFLADLGSTQQQVAHAAACAAAAAARRTPSAARRTQQQQQQGAGGVPPDAAPPERSSEGSEGAEDGWGDDDSEELEDGNCSEQEEATQAAAAGGGLAAAAADEGSQDGSEGSEGGDGGEAAALRAWLERHGVAKYADHFERAGAGLSLLPCLTDGDLQAMGIAALGARKKLLLAAEELVEVVQAAAAGSEGQQQQQQQQGGGGVPTAATGAQAAAQQRAAAAYQELLHERRQSHAQAGASGGGCGGASGVGNWRALSAGGGGPAVVSCDILQYFKPVGGGTAKQKGGGPAPNPGSILAYLRNPDGSTPAAPAAHAAKGAGRGGKPAAQQWAHKAVAAAGGGGKRAWGGGGRAAQVQPMRPWQLVPGTGFVVDRFCNLPQQSPYKHWFLTHFHADHYKGLTGRFDRGTLYCTPPTALLVQQQLRVKPSWIRTVPLNAPIIVEGARVTFIEANHCPGAAMILFEPPGRRAVLHTGDCRLIPEMQQEEALARVRGRAELILDTTYCSPEYAFPPQQEVLRFAIDAVKAEAFNPKTLFLFGSYTIGKERLFLEAARVLQRKVYVSVAKRKILDCLELPPEYASLLTTDDRETNLHAVPLWMVSQKHMAQLLKHYRGRFTNAVGFQPTGWTHQKDAEKTRARGRRRQKGTIITYQVPYSEHSSYSELRAFVDWFRPVNIIPSVNSDGGGPKAQRLVALLRS